MTICISLHSTMGHFFRCARVLLLMSLVITDDPCDVIGNEFDDRP